MTVPNENSVEPTSHAIPRDEPQSQSSLRPSLSLTNEVLVPRQVPGSYSAQVRGGQSTRRNSARRWASIFPELKDIDKPVASVFPEVAVCLDCGTAEFVVPEAELCQLAKGDAAAAG